MNDVMLKGLMGLSIVKMAKELERLHSLSHSIAEVAIQANDETTLEGMTFMCEHFEALDRILKRCAIELDAKLAAEPTLVVQDPNNRGGH